MATRNVNEDCLVDDKLTLCKENEGFSQVKQIQNLIQSVSNCIFNKVSRPNKQSKELRRKERLKNMYIEYMQNLNLKPTTNLDVVVKVPYQSQIKVLISHQSHRLQYSSRSQKTLKAKSSSPLFFLPKSPFISSLISLFSPPSYSNFRDKSSYQITSIFSHPEKNCIKKREHIKTKLEKKLENFKDKAIKRSNRHIRRELQKSVEKIFTLKKNSGYFTVRHRDRNEDEISECRSAIRVGSEETRDQSFTGRSSSATSLRLGFFNGLCRY